MAHKKKVVPRERKAAKKRKSSSPANRKHSKTRIAASARPKAKPKKQFRYIPEWLRAKSERSKAAWRKRWDRGTAHIGVQGQRYIERTYGPTISPSDFGGGPGGGGRDTSGRSDQVRSPVVVPDRSGAAPEVYDYYDEPEEYDDYDFYDREY